MLTKDLLVSGLNITEDEYKYQGLFILSNSDISINVDISELDNENKINEIKNIFSLEEPVIEIRQVLMGIILEKAAISSKIKEGEDYNSETANKDIERSTNSLDLA